MWNSMAPQWGSSPKLLLQSSFHTSAVLPPTVLFPQRIVDKRFSNPNFVNPGRPSRQATVEPDAAMTSGRAKKNRKGRGARRRPSDRPFRKTSLTDEIRELDAVEEDLGEPTDSDTVLSDSVDVGCNFGQDRSPSVCESEDSFIVFEGGDDEEEDEETSEFVEVSPEEEESDDETSLFVPLKKVRFAEEKSLCEVHPMIKWSYAYQAARKGPWEEYARDRERFRRRIFEAERLIGGVFLQQHRAEIYRQRFDV